MNEAPVRTTFRTGLITVAAILAGLAFAAALLPRGFSDDLSRIGQGGNVVVLIHNKDSVQSLDLMTLADAVRSDYAGKAEFLVADTNSGQGRAFIRGQQADGYLLLFFGPDGTRRGALQQVKDEQALRLAIDQAFGRTR